MAAKLSGPGGGKFDVEMNHEINVTPFVDVMLVLLIIFMVAAPLASVNVKINLPPANAKPQTKPPQIIYVSIKADGTYYVGDNQTDLFRASGRPEARGGPEPRRPADLHPRRPGRGIRQVPGCDEHHAGQRVL